jgi:hypothetical protein
MVNLFRKKGYQPGKSIVIVSGLPRSGTSLMMKMLEAGGIPPLTDQVRQADQDNPRGYYEFERVRKLKEGDYAWVRQARGKTVKVVSDLLPHLPQKHKYYVVFMRRNIDEVLASQRLMLTRRDEDADGVEDHEMRGIFEGHLGQVFNWAREQGNLSYIEVSYNDLMSDPVPVIKKINRYLGESLDTTAMEGQIDPKLYRQQRD